MQLTRCDRCHFDAGDYRRHDLVTAPRWLWAYAWVLEPGTIAAGDEVPVEP